MRRTCIMDVWTQPCEVSMFVGTIWEDLLLKICFVFSKILGYGDNWDTTREFAFLLCSTEDWFKKYQLTLCNWNKSRIQMNILMNTWVLCYFRTHKVSGKEEILTSSFLKFPVSTCRFSPAEKRTPASESDPCFKTWLCLLKTVSLDKLSTLLPPLFLHP